MSPETRTRLARVLLAAGAAGLVAVGMRTLPSEQTLVLSLGGERSHVREIRGVILEDGEERSGFERHFPGGAPRRISYVTSLPNGAYQLVVNVVHAISSSPTTTTTHSLELNGDTIVVHVDPLPKP